jgi:disulfide bond formation protein DsbB
VRHTVVDPGFSVDLGRFGGADFLDQGQVMALSENKSFVILREDGGAGPDRNFRFFAESFDAFDEVARSRLSTVRARSMYVMSLAFDPASQSLYTVSVPNRRFGRLVVSRFDRRDLTLSEEFLPAIASDRVTLRGVDRSLDELYVTAATIAAGRLYALSAAYNTLLTIDLARRSVVAAHAIPGLARPTGIAIKGDLLHVVSEDATLFIVGMPGPAPQGR